MKYYIICIFVLVLFFSTCSAAQNKPTWMNAIEKSIKQKETNWKIGNISEKADEGGYQYYCVVNANGSQAVFEINWLKDVPNLSETFEGHVTIFDNLSGKNTKKAKIKDFGDEGYIWFSANESNWSKLYFRKKDIFVKIHFLSIRTDAEITGRKIAQHILEQLP
jgi:hypothetical protein